MKNCPLTGRPCEKPRYFHITEVQNGKGISFDLCEDCLSAYIGHGNDIQLKPTQSNQEVEHIVNELFQFILSDVKNQGITKKCPQCNSSYAEIVKNGKVGCAKCWECFAEELDLVVKKAQCTAHHTGKVPKKWQKNQIQDQKNQIPISFRMKILDDLMQKAISNEEYEKAAKLRDVIKNLNQLIEKYEILKSKLEEATMKKQPIEEIKNQMISLLEEINQSDSL